MLKFTKQYGETVSHRHQHSSDVTLTQTQLNKSSCLAESTVKCFNIWDDSATLAINNQFAIGDEYNSIDIKYFHTITIHSIFLNLRSVYYFKFFYAAVS